jgi:plastocyanin
VALAAANTAFDKKTLTFPANQQITVDFDNQDTGQLHNWSLYTDSTGATPIFQGSFVTGPAKTRYVFSSPGPGSYFFRCDSHPTQMTGTATVT